MPHNKNYVQGAKLSSEFFFWQACNSFLYIRANLLPLIFVFENMSIRQPSCGTHLVAKMLIPLDAYARYVKGFI